jgi:hypothetical protein
MRLMRASWLSTDGQPACGAVRYTRIKSALKSSPGHLPCSDGNSGRMNGSLGDKSLIGRYAYLGWIRSRVHRFVAQSHRAREFQQETLLAKIRRNQNSDFGRDHGFAGIRGVADFRARVPVRGYEEHLPYIAKVLNGEVTALFAPGTKILMFAMTSGTTGEPKRLPITAELFREYRRGWMIWGGGIYGDYPRLMLRKSLQLSSDWQQYRSSVGVPCGQISGLAANTRPKAGRLLFLPPVATTRIHDPAARHYATLRFALTKKNVGIIVTANPSSLVEFARRAQQDSESLIRDIHDGTLSCDAPADVHTALERSVRKRDPRRARELARLADRNSGLLPKHAWPDLSVLAVWTGGSVRVFLQKLPELYGRVVFRDHGLSASEGRMTIPLANDTSAGLLDYYHHYFEFIPVEEHGRPSPTVLGCHELAVGCDYYILLTTSGGLYRYDIRDVVRCVGFRGEAPLLEFLNKGKNFSSITGEKLSEYQVVRAVEKSFSELGSPMEFFAMAPVMESVPRYVLLLEPQQFGERRAELAVRVQAHIEKLNEEYAAKCASGRLLPLAVRAVPSGTWSQMRAEKTGIRGNLEEYKHIFLVQDLGFVERMTAGSCDSSKLPATIPLQAGEQPAPWRPAAA